MGPTKGGLLKFDFPSAKLWVKSFFFWMGGSQSQKTPPPLQTKPAHSPLLGGDPGKYTQCYAPRPVAAVILPKGEITAPPQSLAGDHTL